MLKQTTVKIPPPVAGADGRIVSEPFNLLVFWSYEWNRRQNLVTILQMKKNRHKMSQQRPQALIDSQKAKQNDFSLRSTFRFELFFLSLLKSQILLFRIWAGVGRGYFWRNHTKQTRLILTCENISPVVGIWTALDCNKYCSVSRSTGNPHSYVMAW